MEISLFGLMWLIIKVYHNTDNDFFFLLREKMHILFINLKKQEQQKNCMRSRVGIPGLDDRGVEV